MDHFVLLGSLGALTGVNLLIHLAFRGTSIQSTEGYKTVANEFIPGSMAKVDGTSPRIFIPDVHAGWPWSRQINPHYQEVARESEFWAASMKLFSDKAQKVMEQGKSFSFLLSKSTRPTSHVGLVIGLSHPVASKEILRATCDINHFMFAFDEYSDKATSLEARKMKDMALDAFQKPLTPRPAGELILGEMARQLWERVAQISTNSLKKELIQRMDQYLEACVQQSVDRERRHILDVESYIGERRLTVGAKPLFWCNMLGYDIPSEVMSHSAIQEMSDAAADMIALHNDMIFYNAEQMRGDDLQNVITCVMNEYHTDVNGAMSWVADRISELQKTFLAALGSLPEWDEPLNSHVKGYGFE